MELRSLLSYNFNNGIMPPVYSDHFLLSENLQQPYECPEHTSGIGILLTRKGNCNYYLNGLKYEVNHTNLLFVNRGSQLAIKITGKDAAPTLLFFHSKFVDLVQHSLLNGNEKLLEDPAGELPYDFSYLERIYNHPHFHETVCSLITLGSSCSSFASLKADITIRNLFEDLLKENQDSYRLSQNLQATKAATRLEIFKRVSLAKEWIEQNYNADSNLEEIASIAAMNSQHFLRMFKQIYHITPHQYRMELRLNKAKQLLDSTGLTMAEICQVIGFESAFSFSLLFKKRFGLPPSQFRNG